MKEILSKFGISDFFIYICPGSIIFVSLFLWIKPDFDSNFWKPHLLAAFLILISVYSLGLILASYNRKAQTQYLLLSQPKKDGWLIKVFRLFWKFSSRHPDRYYAEYTIRIKEQIERLDVPPGLSKITTYWEYLEIYRKLIIDRSTDGNKFIEVEAENYQRRSLFAMGISIAIFLVTIQVIFRVIIIELGSIFEIFNNLNGKLHDIDIIHLIVIASIGIIASIGLRQVAFRMFIIELYLTACMRYPVDEEPSTIIIGECG